MDPAVLRILDANLNRAREALRVIEDHARFACDDVAAAERTKGLRHALRDWAGAFGADRLLAERDIAQDVGRELKTAGELRRESAEDVVRAAFGRFTEAARVLSEYGKLVSVEAGGLAERLRYDAYALEQVVMLRGTLRQRLMQTRLYVLLTEQACRRVWLETAEAVLRGGAGCLQLREKGSADGELLERAHRLRELTSRHGALLIINDRPDIARRCGADGVHVGQDDLPVRDARSIAGPRLLVGKSTHTVEQFETAVADEPDYIAVGPMFDSSTKPQEHIAGPETLRTVVPRTHLPLVAIGGITPENVDEVLAAGARCVCVCSAVLGADNPERAAANLASKVDVQ